MPRASLLKALGFTILQALGAHALCLQRWSTGAPTFPGTLLGFLSLSSLPDFLAETYKRPQQIGDAINR